MRRQLVVLGVLCLLLFVLRATATVYYVNGGNAAPAYPFTNWGTAAVNIQDAIDASANGDQILVTNGIYQAGGTVMAGDLTNRVALNKPVTVQSVNGPWVTTIYGAGATNGTKAVRCAWLTNSAALIGFTLQGGATRYGGDLTTLESGGGAWCASSSALVSNCLIISNSADGYGGGVYQGTVVSSLIYSNNAVYGAACQSLLKNCTIVSNTFYGVWNPIAMTNCIIDFNFPGAWSGGGDVFSHCCAAQTLPGTGNITGPPQFFADGIHLTNNSRCIGAGINIGLGADIFGQAWLNPPAIGCAEWQPSPLVAAPQIQLSGDPAGFTVSSAFSGQLPVSLFWLKNGAPLQDNGHFTSSQTPRLIASGGAPDDMGGYQLVVSNSFGMTTSGVAQVTIHCVDINGANPTAPYTTWATAATNIQDAITAAVVGEIVLVTNGVYATGGKSKDGVITNRVSVDKAILVQSVNGPSATIIQGAWDSISTNGPGAVRCAWLATNAILGGFTLCGGATRAYSGVLSGSLVGGGISSGGLFGPPIGTAANCIIVSNTAYEGGGAFLVNLNHCTVTSNLGDGVDLCNLKNCILTGNQGTGASRCFLTNSAMIKNAGVGAYSSELVNCTVSLNSGGGVSFCGLSNCIVYPDSGASVYGNTFSYCCTIPTAPGTGNIGSDPLLLSDGIHLSAGSPCIGAGNASLVSGTDIDGQPWNNPPSIGCDEWLPAPVVTPLVFYGVPARGFTCSVIVAGQPPFACFWTKDGTPIQDDAHYSNSGTASLGVNNLGLDDAGAYQVVVSNSFGVVTSTVAQLAIHVVNAAGTSPVAPYATWATAATNIQDAITAAAVGDIVLVTNGVYATGGKSMDGVITNRVSVDKAILVQSVNGPNATIIQGAWDPVSTNGPGAVRCAWLTLNAVINGFTLRGGATGKANNLSANGGGIWGATNGSPNAGSLSATADNCVIIFNAAGNYGGGAFQVNLNNCILATNLANPVIVYSGYNQGSGGGAAWCNLNNCVVTANQAAYYGGGTYYCFLTNCAVTWNLLTAGGSGAYQSTLVNCTVSHNVGAGVDFCSLYNSIAYLNGDPVFIDNYLNSSFSYSCTTPVVPGVGNITSNPLLLSDGIHLSPASPCIGAGSASMVSGTDIDGQPWSNPPSMGCDEWLPTPVIGVPPAFQLGLAARGLTCSVVVAGQPPFAYFWSKDGTPIQDNVHYGNSSTSNLVLNSFGPDDAGVYQVVVTNSSGAVTSAVSPLVIHAVNAAGTSPVAPYSSWATAATNIQDAINVSTAGDVVLVTNGLYAYAGLVITGDLTNRVALNKPITVISVNGYAATTIQGAWDPVTTNGPGAVRCAYIGDGALLYGFTLQNGATRGTSADGPLGSGGGIYCDSHNGIASNCVLTNNSAMADGGGIAFGTLNNSLIIGNHGYSGGGGAYQTYLNHCTVTGNTADFFPGVYTGAAANSIIMDTSGMVLSFTYSCLYSGHFSGLSNIVVNPQLLDSFHISANSPCRGAGNDLYTAFGVYQKTPGTDLDGEPWANPSSMGCDEVIDSDLVGPLTAGIAAVQTNLFVGRLAGFAGSFTGRAATIGWSFGDGTTATNSGVITHNWTNSGDYPVTFTVFNNDNPGGVSASVMVQVQPLVPPQILAATFMAGTFQFQFTGQTNANYIIQYTTNLSPPAWQTFQTINSNQSSSIQINNVGWTNSSQFFRVLVQ